MSIFNKPLSQLMFEDLQELLNAKAIENLRLEFKKEIPNDDQHTKKLSSFANTFGGYMVVGASEKDGRIDELTGVTAQNGYKQKVVDWCFSKVYPPLVVEISEPISLPYDSAKVCYVLYVPESDTAPHFLNERRGIYIRTDEFSGRAESKLANEAELRSLLNRREAIHLRRENLIKRARNRWETYGAKAAKDAVITGSAKLELSITPRFPARPVCDQTRLRKVLNERRFKLQNATFPDTSKALSQHESELLLSPGKHFSIIEANVWGMLFYATVVDQSSGGYEGIHLGNFVGYLLAFLTHAQAILQDLSFPGPLTIEVALSGIQNKQWLYSNGSYTETGPASQLDNSVSFPLEMDFSSSNPKELVTGILKLVFFATDWSTSTVPANMEGILKTGYYFNGWPWQ